MRGRVEQRVDRDPGLPAEAAYSVARVVNNPARPGNGAVSGAVETMSANTSYAAVATAASIDAFAPKRLLSR